MTKSYTDKSSMLVKSDKELDSKIGKAGLIKGQGPDNIKDIEDPEEDKKYSDGDKAKDMTKESSSYEGAFERLFKATINEEEENEDMDMELEEEVPVTSEDMASEIEETEEEEENLISDLQKVMSQLQGILDKLSEEGEEENEEDNSEEEGEEPYEESVDMTQKSHMKVSGKPQPSKGSAHKGDFKPSPHPKPHKNKGEYLRSKGAMKVKSSVSPGDFFK
jgi:seryl-tRNA synthetase